MKGLEEVRLLSQVSHVQVRVCVIVPAVYLGLVKVMATGVISPSRRCHLKCVMRAWLLI